MAQAIVARENGDAYQRMVLWHHITKLLFRDSDYLKLYTEHPEVKSFDDIVIEYKKPTFKLGIRCIYKEFIQTKFHQYESDTISVENLMNPNFINSTKYSFLQKLKAAHDQLEDQYIRCAFTLYSPFDIDQSDVLYSVINNKDGFINLDKIFDGTKTTKRADAIRTMMNHLNVDEAELKKILGQLKFYRGQRYEELVDLVNFGLEMASFRKISLASAQNPYINLAGKWLEGKIFEITTEFVNFECSSEGLVVCGEQPKFKIAIKTFDKDTRYLCDQSIDTLDLTAFFESGKFIRQDSSWKTIICEIQAFCESHDITNLYEIHLPCSLSIGFIAGSIFSPKSGFSIYPIQKTAFGLQPWNYIDFIDMEPIEDFIISEIQEIADSYNDSILVVSITHDIENDVTEYIDSEGIKYSKMYQIKHKKIGPYAVTDGQQCSSIAEFISSILNRRTRSEKMGLTHLFISAPVSLLFYMGKYSLNFGNLQLYEHDMNFQKDKMYYKSVTLIGGE